MHQVRRPGIPRVEVCKNLILRATRPGTWRLETWVHDRLNEAAIKRMMKDAAEKIEEDLNEYRYSGELLKVNKSDEAADALAIRIGGESRVRFANDTVGREFDVVSNEYIAQAKPDLKSYGKSWRSQTKATFEAAKATGKKAYFQFEGEPSASIL